ncbi:left-right determination factor 2-like [Scleropages formosus]|uniref:left-right determination factor 2-like n=1 Tax=Scleropages formosus TaxID=113540 RepID=UPI0010FA6C5E|nr:left-right determination factor 2-like [Scleropages formosus]
MGPLSMCALCCAALAVVHGFTHEDLKEAMLRKLALDELPGIDERDLEKIVIPTHLKNKYLSMLRLHNSRRRRSLPSLAGILRGIPGNADLSGGIMYSDATRQRMVFDMEARIPERSEVTLAELKLFKTAPPESLGAQEQQQQQRRRRLVQSARVSIYWVDVRDGGSNRTSLVDSRLVPIHETGWKSFDVTQAVHLWSKSGRSSSLLHLEVRIEAERPGSYAAQLAKHVRFRSQDPPSDSSPGGSAEIVLYTLSVEEFGSQGDCGSTDGRACCRQQYFVNFREMSWTQFWVLEPAGYQAFRCDGQCRQPRRGPAYGKRVCAPVESAPLPVMYLVKKGEHTDIEVAEFPNMIVEKCGCAMENVVVV